MSTVTSTTTQSNSAIQQLMNGSTSSTSSSNTNPTTASGIEDRFLTMLVTQMKNQDPLNPMDNAQITTQLAQINTVKGIDSLNTTLQALQSSYNDALAMQSSALIGKSVLSAGNSLALSSSGAYGGVKLASDADKVSVVISDSTGKQVAQEDLGAQKAGVIDFAWDGKDGNGNQLPTGNYTFSVTASSAGKAVTSTALGLGTVSALVKGSSGFQLEIPGAGLIDFSAVEQIY
jgi:flagellar basal-body rod modification protein FlgD